MNVTTNGDTTFLSLGLDIGTTTTHLVISRLTMGPGEDDFGRHHVLDKEIVYRSGIHLTPLCNGNLIDTARIHQIVTREYARAGVRAEDVLTGAVIVTGETALKANAEQMVQRLAGESSSFAAAVAGANQEAILAGRGSGAAEYSRRHHCCTLNIDIGGGTSNLAWFERGEPIAAGAIRVGGRHLVRARDNAHYDVISDTARCLLGSMCVDDALAAEWIESCVRACESVLEGDFSLQHEKFVVTRPGRIPPRADVIFFSGGVGDLMAAIDRGHPMPEIFDDTGPLLARALLASPRIRGWKIEYPSEPIRATVIGAGQFSMDFSGETLWADPELLPLRNLPVLRLPRHLSDLPDTAAIRDTIERERSLKSVEPDQLIAISLPSLRQADWDTVVRFAAQLADAADQARLPSPWVFAMRDNFGRLLGRTIAEARPEQSLVVIDEIDTGDADYIDIGRPVEHFRTVIPVIAKSLVFER